MVFINYHNIEHANMLNGDGLRVILWISGCEHHCDKCQNPQTWNYENGVLFDSEAKKELFNNLGDEYIQGVTFSGGDPLNLKVRDEVFELIEEVKEIYPKKDIWMWTGYVYEDLIKQESMKYLLSKIDVLVDGKYVEELKDVELYWRGSSNQRVIDIKKSLDSGTVVLHCE